MNGINPLSNVDCPKELRCSSASSTTKPQTPMLQKRFETNMDSNKVELEELHYTSKKEQKESIPSSTPTSINKKIRRKSNLFPQLTNRNKMLEEKNKNGELGIGRAIPLRQGYLYKKSMKSLNKDWKKKYVTLTSDGCLTYHPTLHDYMNNVHGKDIPLKHTTVKIPGQKPRGSKAVENGLLPYNLLDSSGQLNNLSNLSLSSDVFSNNERVFHSTNPLTIKEISHLKKRYVRTKSNSNKHDSIQDSDGYEFVIISSNNKQWRFEAITFDEREAWVESIKQQIHSLQEIDIDVSVFRSLTINDSPVMQTIKDVSGDCFCRDCSKPTCQNIEYKPNLSPTNINHTKGQAYPFTVISNTSQALTSVKKNESTLDPNKLLGEYQYSVKKDQKESTPSSTPTTTRKARRKSNLFPQLTNRNKMLEEKNKNGELGIGRAIPLRQGYLYKKSMKSLNKDWKKKYVTLTSDGCLTYHPTLHDYMNNVHGKDIPLKHTTVKIPGQKPRGSKAVENGLLPYNLLDSSGQLNNLSNLSLSSESANSKKRHRRIKSSLNKNEGVEDSPDGYEFIIVSLDNKQWRFEATNGDEREAWVSNIEQQILNGLQGLESDKSKVTDRAAVQAIREIDGNSNCIDCGKPNPDWTSLNLGSLICIECSGIHRNLGTHISRVRSLDLDDWPPGHVAVMMTLGNTVMNTIYEANIKERIKPTPTSSRDEKERWIRSKYEKKEFMNPLPSSPRIEQQLIDAVLKCDMPLTANVLAHISSPEQINSSIYINDLNNPLFIAVNKGCLPLVQILLWYNLEVNIYDRDGHTPLYCARMKGFKEIEELLISAGCTETHFNFNSNTSWKRELCNISTKSEMLDKLPASII